MSYYNTISHAASAQAKKCFPQARKPLCWGHCDLLLFKGCPTLLTIPASFIAIAFALRVLGVLLPIVGGVVVIQGAVARLA